MKTRLLIILFLISVSLHSANEIKITVNSGQYDRYDCIIAADISCMALGKNHAVELYETTNGSYTQTYCQIVPDDNANKKLYFILSGKTMSGQTRTFVAKRKKLSKMPAQTNTMTIEDDKKALILKKDEHPVLAYNYAITPPPEGVDKKYERGGYIHPAYTPSGFVLTTIQPKDHRHHYGIWNPWTKLEYDQKIYDLWNLGDGKGTVRPQAIEATYQGQIMSGYDASLNHIIFNGSEEKIIMNELWKVKAWNINGGFLWDFESILAPSTKLPVLLKEYRYAGFGYRATEIWTKENCEMMTSEGFSRQQIDGTTAKWIYINGKNGDGYAGLLFLGAPDNYNAPEPLRIWNEQANGGRGDAFINFAPTKNKDWNLEPDKRYRLRYRLFAYDGKMTPLKAEQLWNDYANPPTVIVEN